jgi:hypothetical protein
MVSEHTMVGRRLTVLNANCLSAYSPRSVQCWSREAVHSMSNPQLDMYLQPEIQEAIDSIDANVQARSNSQQGEYLDLPIEGIVRRRWNQIPC